jgi:hypothetical protein
MDLQERHKRKLDTREPFNARDIARESGILGNTDHITIDWHSMPGWEIREN